VRQSIRDIFILLNNEKENEEI